MDVEYIKQNATQTGILGSFTWYWLEDILYFEGEGCLYEGLQLTAPWRQHFYPFQNTVTRRIIVSEGCTEITRIFRRCMVLEELVLPQSLERIEDAFNFCKSLKKIEFPRSMKEINFSFEGCDSLEEVVIPEGVTYVGHRCFMGCSGLTSVTLPESLERLGEGAFSHCPKLREIKLPENHLHYAVEGDMLIKKANGNLGNLVLYLGEGGRYVVPEKIKSIWPCAFAGRDITEIVFHREIRRILRGTFAGCKKLKTMVIPETIVEIGQQTFEGSGLKSVTLPEGLREIPDRCFANTELETVEIPKNVTSIYGSAFENCRKLTDVRLPEGLKFISGAFQGCTSLQSITLPEGLEEMHGSFAYSGLESVVVPKSVTKIGSVTFSGCKKLRHVVIPEGVRTIGADAFRGCEALVSWRSSARSPILEDGKVLLPAALQALGNGALNECPLLTEVVIPEGVQTIEGTVFSGCVGLERIKIPSGLKRIGDYAFKNCQKLTKLSLPDTLTEIGAEAFYNCHRLHGLEIPSGVEKIGKNAFLFIRLLRYDGPAVPEAGDSKWGAEVWPGHPEPGQEEFYGSFANGFTWYCQGEKLVITGTGVLEISWHKDPGTITRLQKTVKKLFLQEGCTAIGAAAFSGFENLEQVVLPRTLQRIGNWAFYGCRKLQTLYIPEGVTQIGVQAFRGVGEVEHYLEQVPKDLWGAEWCGNLSLYWLIK